MRNYILTLTLFAALYITGVIILNMQLRDTARTELLTGSKYIIKSINNMLTEARDVTRKSIVHNDKKCGIEGQYMLATMAALYPHIRTIFIVKQGEIWCSSLPDNRVLLINPLALPESRLLLLAGKNTVNGLPVLLYQTIFDDYRVVVTISDRHIRNALQTVLVDATYSLRVDDNLIETSGDVSPVNNKSQSVENVKAIDFPFSIEYTPPPIFSLNRLISQGRSILFFLLLIASLAAYVMYKYLNKNTLPEESLRIAINNGEIVPFYQPVVNGRNGTIRGVEVLARWKHPKTGYISPGSFIPIAEKSGLIVPLTRNLMIQVVTQINSISSNLPTDFHVGINFSASHIALPEFVDECLKYKKNFIRKDLKLVIEVTEREPLDINEQLIQTLNMLNANGFSIALDDFGNGYSGLSYLQDLHIDYIKIDHSFVSRVNEHQDSTQVLDCVLDLARKLSISIVAEGVETKAQLDYLNRNNIVFLQGYYFFKPMPFIELHALMSKYK